MYVVSLFKLAQYSNKIYRVSDDIGLDFGCYLLPGYNSWFEAWNIHGACKACLAEQGSGNYDTLPDFKMVIQYFILLPWAERSQLMD